jgi:hypothetical protein
MAHFGFPGGVLEVLDGGVPVDAILSTDLRVHSGPCYPPALHMAHRGAAQPTSVWTVQSTALITTSSDTCTTRWTCLLERWTCLGVPDERPRGAAADLLRSLDQVGLEGLTVTAPRRVEHGDHLVVLLAEVAEVLVREVHDFSCRQRTPRQHIGVCSGCASQAKTEQAPLPWSSSFQTSSFLNGCTTSTTSRPGSAPLPS